MVMGSSHADNMYLMYDNFLVIPSHIRVAWITLPSAYHNQTPYYSSATNDNDLNNL